MNAICLFVPDGLRKFKLDLFNRIAATITRAGGSSIRGNIADLAALPDNIMPIIGCTPEIRPIIDAWMARNRRFCYWDRGYLRRVFATWLPRGESGGYYRYHINSFQMQKVRNVPSDRWDSLKTPIHPWQKNGRHIVIACPTPTYSRFHKLDNWTEQTIRALSLLTTRQLVVRDKETKRPLQEDLKDAHCLVAHGSNTAVEAAILGCPVFVDPSSAAALIGLTNLNQIERPVYPERAGWCHALAYSCYCERELETGEVWRLLE